MSPGGVCRGKSSILLAQAQLSSTDSMGGFPLPSFSSVLPVFSLPLRRWKIGPVAPGLAAVTRKYFGILTGWIEEMMQVKVVMTGVALGKRGVIVLVAIDIWSCLDRGAFACLVAPETIYKYPWCQLQAHGKFFTGASNRS